MNSQSTYEAMIDSQVRSLVEVTRAGGGRWPMPVFKNSSSLSFYSSPYIIPTFMEVTNGLLKKGLSFRDIGRTYRHPSRLARLMHLFPARPLWSVPKEQHIEVGYRLASILETMYEKHPFCEDDRNFIYSNEEVCNRFSLDETHTDTQFSVADIHALSAFLWMLAEAFSPRFQNTFFEFSGPYHHHDDWFLVKEYHNLKPRYLPINFHYSFSDLTIIEVYHQFVDVRFDIMNRSKAAERISDPIGYSVFMDGERLEDPLAVKIMKEHVVQTLQEAMSHLAAFKNKTSMALFNAKAEMYSLLFPLLGEEAFTLMNEIEEGTRNPKVIAKREVVMKRTDTIPRNEEGWRRLMDLRVEI